MKGKVLNIYPVFCYKYIKVVVVEGENGPVSYAVPKNRLPKGLRRGIIVTVTNSVKKGITIKQPHLPKGI